MTQYAISDIKVTGRHRKDLGDIASLAESIRSVGLLHPIVITAEGRLVAGERRLEACRSLGWTEVPVTIASQLQAIVQLLQAERDENTCRLDMKPTEKIALGAELEKLVKPQAQARIAATQAKPGEGKVGSGNFTEPKEKGETREIVGGAVGMSGPTYQRAKAVVETANDETQPTRVREVAQAAVEEMDRTGKVLGPYNKVRAAKAPQPAKPTGRSPHQRKTTHLLPALSTLSGSASAVAQIPTDDLGDEERETAFKQLTEVIQQLRRFRAQLKGEQ